MPENPIILIDAFAQIYRGYYAIRSLTNSKQQPVNAIYALAKFLLKMHKEYPSAKGAFVFDRGKPAFRLELAPDYKANRSPMPDDMREQMPYIEDMVEAFGWPKLGNEKYEADDLIAAIAADYPDEPVRIVSSDKDIAQVINERVKMLVPDRKNGFELRGPQEVVDKFNVSPGQIIDYLALIGDNSDNIPGVSGVGPKTAAGLIAQFGSLDAILADPEAITNEKLRDKIVASTDILRKNVKLVTLLTDIPEKTWCAENGIARREPNWEKILEMCEELELRAIAKEVTELAAPPDLFGGGESSKEQKPQDDADSGPDKFAPDLFGGM